MDACFSDLILPSGKRAVLSRELFGHDMERAFDIAPSSNMIALSLCLFAQAGSIDGERKTYEELRHELSALDAYRIALWTNAGYPRQEDKPSESPLA